MNKTTSYYSFNICCLKLGKITDKNLIPLPVFTVPVNFIFYFLINNCVHVYILCYWCACFFNSLFALLFTSFQNETSYEIIL